MWHLEAVYNHQYSHKLCFTQMHTRSNHRRDLSAALRHHIIWFTILGSIVLYRMSLAVLVHYLGTQLCNKYMNQCFHNAVALARHYHGFNLFITFTLNPSWPVLTNELLPG